MKELKYKILPQTILEQGINKRLEHLEENLVRIYKLLCIKAEREESVWIINQLITSYEKYTYTLYSFYNLMQNSEELDRLYNLEEEMYKSIVNEIYPILNKMKIKEGVVL